MPTVGDDNDQRPPLGISQVLALHRRVHLQQAGGERRSPTGRHAFQPGGGGVDRRGRRQEHLGFCPTERDQSHLVPTLVGVEQQRQHGPLHRGHAPLRSHGSAGIDREQHEVRLASFAPTLTQVVVPQHQPGAVSPALTLVGRAGHEGGREMKVV